MFGKRTASGHISHRPQGPALYSAHRQPARTTACPRSHCCSPISARLAASRPGAAVSVAHREAEESVASHAGAPRCVAITRDFVGPVELDPTTPWIERAIVRANLGIFRRLELRCGPLWS